MEDRIRKEVEKLLRDKGGDRIYKEKKEELIKDLEKRYRDLIEVGKSPEEAYQIIRGSINLEEYLKEPINPEYQSATLNEEQSKIEEKKKQKSGNNVTAFVTSLVLITGLVALMLTVIVSRREALEKHTPITNINIKDITKDSIKGLKEEIQNNFSEEGSLSLVKQEEVNLEGIKSVECEVGRAGIVIYLTDGDNLQVNESTNETGEKELFELVREGNSIVISLKDNKLNWGHQPEYRIELHIPQSYRERMSVTAASGDIEVISDIDLSEMQIITASGDITASNIQVEKFSLQATSGEIELRGLQGKGRVETASGDIKIDKFSGMGEILAVSGEITMEIEALAGDLSVETTSGDIQLDFNQTVSGNIKMATNSGVLKGNMQIEYKDENRKEGSIVLGSGSSNSIKVEAESGNIKVNK